MTLAHGGRRVIWWRPIRHVGSVSHAITIPMRDTADVAAWLRELGLERYEQAFRENEIDARDPARAD